MLWEYLWWSIGHTFGKGAYTVLFYRGRVVNTSQINQVKRNNNENNRNTPKKPTETNPIILTNPKSAQKLRGNNPIIQNKNAKDYKKGLYLQ